MLKYALAFILGAVCTIRVKAQQTPPIASQTYPTGIFRYPLDLPPSTAGSFGELRPMHFHSGLDFKTNQREGYPVHAVYDGYVSRLRVQFGGFGNAVYIAHPNGFTSVYGHLQRFSPELEAAVRQEQFKEQKFEVDFNPNLLLFSVTKGQVIAWSGNTGGSAGPHLHFELRDTKTEETINAQLFGLTIPDHVPPSLFGISVYHLNGMPFSERTARNDFAVTSAAGHYHLVHPQVISVGPETGFGITANDMNSTSANRNGIYSLELKLDGKTIYTFVVERFAFDQTHAINAYIDYPAFLTSGRWIQKCFILPGSKISLYPQSINRGIVKLTDDAIHDLDYVVKDVAGNTSTLSLKIKANPAERALAPPAGSVRFHYDQDNIFSADNNKLKLVIPQGNLYDDVDFTFQVLPRRPGSYSATYRLHNRMTPIHDHYQVYIKPDSTIGTLANKAIVFNTVSGSEGGDYVDGYIKADAHDFGEVYVRLDTVPPYIRPLNIVKGGSMAGKRNISFKIGDELSGVASYSGKIDGKWVLMEWDFKTRILSYTFGSDIASGKHAIDIIVTDKKDNTAHYTAEFYR